MFASMFGVARLLGVVSFSGDPFGVDFHGNGSTTYASNGSLTVGSNSTTVGTGVATVVMSAVLATGVYSLIVTSVALAVVSGIMVLGSGLSSVSVMAIFKSGACYSIWFLFSVSALIMFMEVPVFGLPLYFLLTLVYSLGVLGTIGFGGG